MPPDEIDRNIGRNIRLRRIARGKAQQELAAQIGISAQQLQKYEMAINRVSASRLFQISLILGVPLNDFFIDACAGRFDPVEPPCPTSFLQSEK